MLFSVFQKAQLDIIENCFSSIECIWRGQFSGNKDTEGNGVFQRAYFSQGAFWFPGFGRNGGWKSGIFFLNGEAEKRGLVLYVTERGGVYLPLNGRQKEI